MPHSGTLPLLGTPSPARCSPLLPPAGSHRTDPPARHAGDDILPGGWHGAPAARLQDPLPGAVREAVGQGAEHLLLLLGAAQALVVASLAHGRGGGGGCGAAASGGLCGDARACLGVARAGAGLGITWQKVAAVPENSKRVKVTATVMEGRGGDGGMQRRQGKEKGGQPLEHPSSPQSQPGTAVFLLAQQPYCPPAVPAPAPEQRGGGIAASPSAALAAPFSPHPDTVQPASGDAVQAAGRRRRMRGEHRPAAGALWQAGWVRRHRNPLLGTCRGVGWGLWGWQRPQHPSRFPVPAEGGWDALGRWLLRSDPAALAHAQQGLESSQAPAGTAGMGTWEGAHQDSSQDQSSPPTPSQGAGGLLDLCQVLRQAQPPAWAGGTGKPPPWMGNPSSAHGDWCIPQHCLAAAPL